MADRILIGTRKGLFEARRGRDGWTFSAPKLQGLPVLVPVYIGAYSYRGTPYRVLVNGQSGTLVGDAPTDWVKVVLVALAVIVAIGVLIGAVLLCSGIVAALGSL